MHRLGGVEEELLAISPPPEFQDIPAPPPAVFRDLSPAASGNTLRLPKPVYKGRITPAEVSDFASRISFDILNEAMVIATEEVLSSSGNHGGGNSSDCTRTAPYQHQFDSAFSSDSSDDEVSHPLSTTTSWEYLSKASSWSDLRDISQSNRSPSKFSKSHRVRTSPLHKIENNSSNCSNVSNSRLSQICNVCSNQNPVSFHNEKCTCIDMSQTTTTVSHLARSASLQIQVNSYQHQHHEPRVMKQTNDAYETSVQNRNRVSKSKTSPTSQTESSSSIHRNVKKSTENTDDDNDCYNLPYQCDIYSYPIDSIAPNEINSTRRPIAAPRRSRLGNSQLMNASVKTETSLDTAVCRGKSPENLRVFSGCGSSQPPLPGPSTLISKYNGESTKHKTSLSTALSLDITLVESQTESGRRVALFNNSAEDETRKPARRSRSVEMKMSDVENYHDTSRIRVISKENRPRCETALVSTKSEKRTLGHSILNLFKRKPRSKAYNVSSSTVTSFPPIESDDYKKEHSICITPTIARALPPTPTPAVLPTESSSAFDLEPAVQISNFAHHMEVNWNDEEAPSRISSSVDVVEVKDFAASIEKVKDCGWYWGPLSGEAAEELLQGEPDGSFIVRDSSDAHYIFSLTFKLNGLVRHVRIEHDQGNFSFGPLTRFKASTIVDFVEEAVAHSRSGRYLFFLHRRPVLGPMRVQLLHPYSRYKHHRSLQHMCRFVILKYVRRDLISTLPLPKPLQDYLNTPHYYFETHTERARKISS